MTSSDPRATIPGSEKTLPSGAQPAGTPDPDARLDVTLRLRPRSSIQPRATGTAMTRAQFAESYGARDTDLAQVEAFAHDHHLTVLEASAERRTVIVQGRLADIEAAFGVQLELYTWHDASFRGRSGTVSVPAHLADVIEGVFGLDDRPQARTHFRYLNRPGIAHPHAATQAFTPLDLAAAYGFPEGDGAGQTIAIIELGGGYRAADLKTYFEGLGLKTPSVTAVSVDGGRNAPSGDPNSADGEVMLDIEVAGAVAPGAHIAVYFAPNTDAGFLNAVTQATHDTRRKPSVISISWGAPESAWTTQAMQNMTQAFQEAALLGVTVLCAAGDGGSADGAGGGAHADFPASSPYATGCGGTRLTVRDGRITEETVWNDPRGGATGGGVSDVFDLPDYQRDANVPPSANPGGRVGRGVPDVAGVADPATGYKVRVDGQDTVIGGTSAVSPLWAGLVARLNATRGQPVGFLNPLLYPLGTLRDITEGDNGDYRAGPGWDACTGLGSPDGPKLAEALGQPQ